MSTPTTLSQYPTSKPTPRSAGTGLTPSASSPPARSAPSPAYLNVSSQNPKAGKSPYKHPHSTSQTPFLNSTSNVHTPTPPGQASGPSPGTVLEGLLGRTRAGTLGAKSVTGSDANTPGMSGLGLGITTPGQLNDAAILEGLSLSLRDENWNAQRIKDIVGLLGTRWGLVSQENVERCLKRIGGLECLWEGGVGSAEGQGAQHRTLSIAGNEILIDIDWTRETVTRVALSYPKPSGAVTSDDRGSEILKKDLVGWEKDHVGGYVPLQRFVYNLQRLARTDQLGKDKVSCFEALEGIYASLKKLWDWELGKTKLERSEKPYHVASDLEVMCEKSGQAATHSKDKIGLKLDYWIERKVLASAMREAGGELQPWALLIDCEAFDANQYPPIRVSNAWISDKVGEAMTQNTSTTEEAQMYIDWQEPEPTLMPVQEDGGAVDAMDISMTSRIQPYVRFIARLEPPVTLPLKTAIEIFDLIGQPILQETIHNTTFASLLFPSSLPSAADLMHTAPNSSRDTTIHFQRALSSFEENGRSQSHTFDFNIFSQPDSWARTVHEIPFSHPKQLIAILPYLRQWAFFGRLLQRSVGIGSPLESHVESHSEPGKPTPVRPKKAPRNPDPMDIPSDTDSSDEDNDNPQTNTSRSKPSRHPTAEKGAKHPVLDVLFIHGASAPRIDLLFSIPRLDGSSPVRTHFRIFPNARLEITSDEVNEDDHEAATMREKMLKVLRISEDLGVLAAWVLKEENEREKGGEDVKMEEW